MITKATLNKIRELEDMAVWLRDEVMDEDNWKLNAVALDEVICRKLVKCGLLERKDGNYHYAGQYYRPTISIIAENRRDKYKTGLAAHSRKDRKTILYICDEKKCYRDECLNPECHHTTDIKHRKKEKDNPTVFIEDNNGNLWEEYQFEIKGR